MKNIVITTHWTDGDVLPFVRIGRELKKIGHHVVILTHSYYEKLITDEGLEFEPIDTIEQYQNMMRDMQGNIDTITSPEAIDEYREKYENNEIRYMEYQKIEAYCKDKDTLLIAKNRSSIASYLVAEKLNIPIAQVFMAPYEIISILNFQEFYGERALPQINELRTKVGLSPVDSWLNVIQYPKINVGLWPEWFASNDEVWNTPLVYTGFPWQEKNKENNSNQSLDEFWRFKEQYPDLLLLTGGTSKMLKDNFYSSVVEALKEKNQPAIILTKYKELVPENLPSYIKWFSYLPLDTIMEDFRAIIHHGGIGTLCGALSKGVPQLILGHFVDRPYNGSLMKTIGIAEYLPPARWKVRNICNALDKITTDDNICNCKKFAERTRQQNAYSELIQIVENM